MGMKSYAHEQVDASSELDGKESVIRSMIIPYEMREYASIILPQHLYMIEDQICENSKAKQFYLGHGVSVFNEDTREVFFVVPVVRRGRIVATLELVDGSEGYESTLSTKLLKQMEEIVSEHEI